MWRFTGWRGVVLVPCGPPSTPALSLDHTFAWGSVFVVYYACKYVVSAALRRFKRHRFWHEEFIGFLDELFFIFSLLFVIFFFKSEALSLAYVTLIGGFIFVRTQYYFSHHPDAAPWRTVNRAVFLLAGFLFLL